MGELQRRIGDCIKKNFELEKEIRKIDDQIHLFVLNRISHQVQKIVSE